MISYLKFKKRWKAEVVPERKPPALKLTKLREAIPAPTKAKILDVSTMTEVWKILDKDNKNLQDVKQS